jgi:hypothetical protein
MASSLKEGRPTFASATLACAAKINVEEVLQRQVPRAANTGFAGFSNQYLGYPKIQVKRDLLNSAVFECQKRMAQLGTRHLVSKWQTPYLMITILDSLQRAISAEWLNSTSSEADRERERRVMSLKTLYVYCLEFNAGS